MKSLAVILIVLLVGCTQKEYQYPTAEEPFDVQVRYSDGQIDTVYGVDRIFYQDMGTNTIHLIRKKVTVAILPIEKTSNPVISATKITPPKR